MVLKVSGAEGGRLNQFLQETFIFSDETNHDRGRKKIDTEAKIYVQMLLSIFFNMTNSLE